VAGAGGANLPNASWRIVPTEGGVPIMKQADLVQRISLEPNPALLEHARTRAESVQNRIAARITAFAGSMAFVYIHVVWFACWIGFGVEKYPTAS